MSWGLLWDRREEFAAKVNAAGPSALKVEAQAVVGLVNKANAEGNPAEAAVRAAALFHGAVAGGAELAEGVGIVNKDKWPYLVRWGLADGGSSSGSGLVASAAVETFLNVNHVQSGPNGGQFTGPLESHIASKGSEPTKTESKIISNERGRSARGTPTTLRAQAQNDFEIAKDEAALANEEFETATKDVPHGLGKLFSKGKAELTPEQQGLKERAAAADTQLKAADKAYSAAAEAANQNNPAYRAIKGVFPDAIIAKAASNNAQSKTIMNPTADQVAKEREAVGGMLSRPGYLASQNFNDEANIRAKALSEGRIAGKDEIKKAINEKHTEAEAKFWTAAIVGAVAVHEIRKH